MVAVAVLDGGVGGVRAEGVGVVGLDAHVLKSGGKEERWERGGFGVR